MKREAVDHEPISTDMIRLEQLSREFHVGDQTIHALDHIDLGIQAGEFVAIMGRSGSGKTTLLNMLGCLDQPDVGAYYLEENEVSAMDDDELSRIRNRYMGFVFQTFHLLPRKTALENVLLPRNFHELGLREQDHDRARELLHRVGLSDRLDHKPNELSGGQSQRVAIARALINKPRVILADEPTGNLDSRTSDAIMELLQELNHEGQTIVMVTHEPDIANRSSRQIFMQDGQIKNAHVFA